MSYFKKIKKPILIAEISANHNGSLSRARKLIKCAKINGADFVKFQTYEPRHMTLNSNRKEFFIKSGLWRGQTLWQLYSKAQTPLIWQSDLFKYAKKVGIKAFSSPFDTECVSVLEKIKCPLYKLASFEMTDFSLIKAICETKKPIIISTGLSSIREIERTLTFAQKNGAKDIALLYCVTSYPAKIEDFHLKNIEILKQTFGFTVGLSDHSNDHLIGQLAISMGAKIFEKHIALANQKKGFDIEFSLKGNEILKYKNNLLKAHKLITGNNFKRSKNEKKLLIHRRSIYAIKNIKKGDKFSVDNIKALRPNNKVGSENFFDVIGKKAKKNIHKFTPLRRKDFV